MSVETYLRQLDSFTKKLEYGSLATVIGRYYAMDRDKRWERTKIAVDCLVDGKGENNSDVLQVIQHQKIDCCG